MKAQNFWHAFLRTLSNFLVFFLMVAFVVTCTTMLFVSAMSASMGTELTEELITTAAKLTFINVIVLSLLFTVFDRARRALTVDLATKHIGDAAKRIIAGDYSARVSPVGRFGIDESFGVIAMCFNKMAEELSGVETLRTDFIANVSHELKTPLTVMQNYGTMLQQPGLPEEKRIEYAKKITDASRRLSELISNILRLNKLENSQIYPTAAEFNLSEQLCQCLLSFENVWEEKSLEIETDICDELYVTADEELLSLIWNNLMSNAFKFTPPGGLVSITLREESEHVFVTISDSGCGISPEVGKHIFEKFYQGDPSHASQGNGLGLALVKRVVDIVHGEIQVKSAPGKGSSFTVKLRRKPDETA